MDKFKIRNKNIDNKMAMITKNIVYGFGTKMITIILSIVLPRLFIVSFGSEVNGLLSTITQIFTYLALLEAGIGTATINALYKPLDCDNKDEVNVVVSQARFYYRKVSLVYATCVVIFAIVYSFLAKTSLGVGTVFLVILLQGAASFISYYFCAVYVQLLVADGKQYISDNINFLIHVLTNIIKIVIVLLGYNIVYVQLGFLIVALIKIPILFGICKKRYPWIHFSKTNIVDKIHERGAFIVHELSSTIFSNTDIFVISMFCSLSLASVYSVYNLVFGALNSMINTANAGLGFVLGQNYYKDTNKFKSIYDTYSSIYSTIVFIVMTMAYVLIIPFIKIYTRGISDIDYIILGLPILFAVINIMSGVRAVAARLITVSGHAKKTQSHSVAEMIINLLASLILVQIIGIYGVLFGTIIALLYRMNDIIIYANRIILKRSPIKEYFRLLCNSAIFIGIIIFNYYFPVQAESYMVLVAKAFLEGCIVCVIYMVMYVLLCKKETKTIIGLIKTGSENNDK